MKKTVKKRSVVPVYGVAAVWLVGTFLSKARGLAGLLILSAVSVGAFFLLRDAFPDTVLVVEEPEPEPKDPQIAALKKERDDALKEMRRLNQSIQDEALSLQIDRIEAATRKIFQVVMEKPEKKSELRTFLNYYLPTTLKLLREYEHMTDLGISGQNVDASRKKIAGMMDTVVIAFERQLDALFSDSAMDISADVTVLEQMMQQQGLS